MEPEKINSLEILLEEASDECVDSSVIWWIYAAFTDKLLLDYWDPKTDMPEKLKEMQGRLLELRIFSEKAEYKACRGDIGHDLRCRKIFDNRKEPEENSDDVNKSEEKYFDETQYLDINMKTAIENNKSGKPSWQVMTTTGGGPYNVPLEDVADACVVVRNYLSYSKYNGQVYINDFRLVKLDNISSEIDEESAGK